MGDRKRETGDVRRETTYKIRDTVTGYVRQETRDSIKETGYRRHETRYVRQEMHEKGDMRQET